MLGSGAGKSGIYLPKPRGRRLELEGRLIAVSNRVSRPSGGVAPGGLAQAVSEALAEEGGTWVGWSGRTPNRPGELILENAGAVDYALLDLEKHLFRGFYEGYANGVLWPTFHNRADLAVQDSDAFAAYREVNEAFAKSVATVARLNDIVWVHDYHFLLLGEALRAAGVTNRVGLFLHIPFPHLSTFRTIPEAAEIAAALMHFDTVQVQTRRDARNLAESLAELGHGTVMRKADGYEAWGFGRRVRVTALPIGIDVEAMRRLVSAPPPREVRGAIAALAGRQSVVGVDRLDYSKGLPLKLEAFGRYLQADPDRAEKVVLTQITPISRGTVPAYAETRKQLEGIAGRINAQFATLDTVPLRFLTRHYDRPAVAHMMAASDAGLVTPTADGMNLVAKEYVAAQDPADPGVLILSEFAGAAEMMTAALLVNPHDASGVAEAIDAALAMPLAERRERHRALMQVVDETHIRRWTERCLADLAAAGD